MKSVCFHRNFQKQFKKLPKNIQQRFWERLYLWQEQPWHPLLNHHVLGGNLAGFHSINITGDIRAIYEDASDSWVVYLMIGSHSELYE